MGFLRDMLNPKKHFDDTKRSLGALARGDIKGAIDPAQLLIKSKPGMGAPIANQGDGYGMYGGDPNDPAYGSFSKPFTVEDFYNQQDPGYAFELQQGTQSLQNAASAGSGAFSGAALKDLLGYSQNFARTGYNDAFNRHQVQTGNIFSRLSDIAHLGQNAAAGVGSQGTALAGNAGQMISNAGSAAGAGIVGAGNAAGQGLTNYWLMRQFNQPSAPAGGGYKGITGPVGYQV
jgi:hypothetical protein